MLGGAAGVNDLPSKMAGVLATLKAAAADCFAAQAGFGQRGDGPNEATAGLLLA